jgi:hypothetical protein
MNSAERSLLEAIKVSGSVGRTCDELEVLFSTRTPQVISTAVANLRNMGAIKDSGDSRPTRKGASARVVVWVNPTPRVYPSVETALKDFEQELQRAGYQHDTLNQVVTYLLPRILRKTLLTKEQAFKALEDDGGLVESTKNNFRSWMQKFYFWMSGYHVLRCRTARVTDSSSQALPNKKIKTYRLNPQRKPRKPREYKRGPASPEEERKISPEVRVAFQTLYDALNHERNNGWNTTSEAAADMWLDRLDTLVPRPVED